MNEATATTITLKAIPIGLFEKIAGIDKWKKLKINCSIYIPKIANVELKITILNFCVAFTKPVLYKKNMPNKANNVPIAA